MSMIHSTHLLDWKLYAGTIGGPSRDPEDPKDWKDAAAAIRALCRPDQFSRMPGWKQVLIRDHVPFEDLLEPKRNETIQDLRDLHFLGILCCCTEEGEGYDEYWDLLKTGLRHPLGDGLANDLVLGQYWEGSAWDFVPDLITYQFGFLEGERLNACSTSALGASELTLVETLGQLDLSETYPLYEENLDQDATQGVLDAFRQMQRNLKRAKANGLALFYVLS